MCFSSSPFWNSGVEVDRKFRSEDLIGHLLSDDTTPRQKDDDSVEFNDAMPQYESFDFSLPYWIAQLLKKVHLGAFMIPDNLVHLILIPLINIR